MTTAAVTGLGIVSPLGVDLDTYWTNLLLGRSKIAEIDRFDVSAFPVRYAGMIPPFEAEDSVRKKLVPQTDRITRIAMVAADSALANASVDPQSLDGYQAGVAVSSSTGGLEFGQRQLQTLWHEGWETVSPYMSFAWYYAVNTGQISIKNKLRGPGCVVVSEQAAGLDAVAYAKHRVCTDVPTMLAGAVDGLLCPYGMAVLGVAPEVNRSSEPASYQPFVATSQGYFPGEGGAILTVQRWDRTGDPARAYAVVAGSAAAFDPDPRTGDGLRRAAAQALHRSGCRPGDVDAVFADAYGDPDLDGAEARVLADLFGARAVPVTAPKTMFGRLMGGGAALDVATACLSLRHQTLPPAGLPADAIVDDSVALIRSATPAELRTVLVLARGHGGFASALVLQRP
ncbi:beta-ketoacyl synthase N-terminal-like domain-containing protein [Nocardia alba]|uniref:Act minimal PKS chain-length factor (CLF/KS beta) n=1 Tax=Nocardia alba TaxID=225051 RepID=A0A4V6NCI1_9NOCA|nr:beta-ketoacyl synthase N-terminal-like domain-containing protein [Nocardia alba]TCJ89885.1 act minimal PKS chain-length factor (CLF/KS beta) [Nocardia alba]